MSHDFELSRPASGSSDRSGEKVVLGGKVIGIRVGSRGTLPSCPGCSRDACAINEVGTEFWCFRNGEGRWLPVDPSIQPPALPATIYVAPVLPAPEVRDAGYRAFLGQLGLTAEDNERLLKRGLTESEIARHGYKSLPSERRHATKLRGILAAEIAIGIDAVAEIPLLRDWAYHVDSLVIPIKDVAGRVVGVRFRKEGVKGKYRHAKGLPAQVHVAKPEVVKDQRIWVTEGEIKANISADKLGAVVLGLPGSNVGHGAVVEIVKALSQDKVASVVVALDADWRTNKDVKRSRKSLIEACKRAGFQVQVADWQADKAKGLDDLLVAGHQPLIQSADETANRSLATIAPKPQSVEELAALYDRRWEDLRKDLRSLAWKWKHAFNPQVLHNLEQVSDGAGAALLRQVMEHWKLDAEATNSSPILSRRYVEAEFELLRKAASWASPFIKALKGNLEAAVECRHYGAAEICESHEVVGRHLSFPCGRSTCVACSVSKADASVALIRDAWNFTERVLGVEISLAADRTYSVVDKALESFKKKAGSDRMREALWIRSPFGLLVLWSADANTAFLSPKAFLDEMVSHARQSLEVPGDVARLDPQPGFKVVYDKVARHLYARIRLLIGYLVAKDAKGLADERWFGRVTAYGKGRKCSLFYPNDEDIRHHISAEASKFKDHDGCARCKQAGRTRSRYAVTDDRERRLIALTSYTPGADGARKLDGGASAKTPRIKPSMLPLILPPVVELKPEEKATGVRLGLLPAAEGGQKEMFVDEPGD